MEVGNRWYDYHGCIWTRRTLFIYIYIYVCVWIYHTYHLSRYLGASIDCYHFYLRTYYKYRLISGCWDSFVIFRNIEQSQTDKAIDSHHGIQSYILTELRLNFNLEEGWHFCPLPRSVLVQYNRFSLLLSPEDISNAMHALHRHGKVYLSNCSWFTLQPLLHFPK